MKILSPIYKKHFYWALALHIILLILICKNWQSINDQVAVTQPTNPVINAVVINSQPTTKPAAPVKATQPPAPVPKPAPAPEVVKPEKMEPPKPEPQIEKKVQQPVPKPIPKPTPTPTKKVVPVVDKQQQDKLRQQREAALQKQLQDEQLQQQKSQAAKNRATAEKLLQQQLAAENPNAENKPAAATAGVVDEYKALIIAAVSQQWIVPPNANDKFCKLLVHLAPGGVVLDVSVVQSSGDSALDRSARAAVFKASPLPVPKETALFDSFRELNLTVHPKNV